MMFKLGPLMTLLHLHFSILKCIFTDILNYPAYSLLLMLLKSTDIYFDYKDTETAVSTSSGVADCKTPFPLFHIRSNSYKILADKS